VQEVKKFLRLRTLLALAALVVVVLLLAAAQGIGQSGSNQTPSETVTAAGAGDSSKDDRKAPAKDFWAVVNSDGTLARDRGAVSSQRFTNGEYEVIFSRNVRNCAYVATIGLSGSFGISPPGEITVVGRFGNRRGVYVTTHDSTGAFADRSFHLQVSC
jgi:ABC-type antimicrobial peptide transport system permease subunit